MAGEYVNLNEVGALTRSGQGYDSTAEDNAAESRTFAGRMEASRHGIRGATGDTFNAVTAMHGDNLVRVAHHITDQALRAIGVERGLVQGDQDADATQTGTLSATENQASAVNKPITY